MQDSWIECGQIKTYQDSFCLDATVLQTSSQDYYIWAQKEIGSATDENYYIGFLYADVNTDLDEVDV